MEAQSNLTVHIAHLDCALRKCVMIRYTGRHLIARKALDDHHEKRFGVQYISTLCSNRYSENLDETDFGLVCSNHRQLHD